MKKLLFLLMMPVLCFGQTAEEYFNSAMVKSKNNNYNGAISDYTKSIELINKKNFQPKNSYEELIAEELSKNLSSAYNNRGKLKKIIKDYDGAMDDYNKAITIYSNNHSAYHNRGILKRILNDNKGSISDFTKSINLNPDKDSYYNRGISKVAINDSEGAISDFSEAINLDSNFSNAYLSRALSKSQINLSPCSDFKSACDLGDSFSCEYLCK
tara:strand:- start:50 stop:688 length:639 start_codon:yes stop_codon:yes gene_type:complete